MKISSKDSILISNYWLLTWKNLLNPSQNGWENLVLWSTKPKQKYSFFTSTNAKYCLSVRELKISLHYPKHNIRYLNLHYISNRVTPNMISSYELSLPLHKLYYSQIHIEELVHPNVNFSWVKYFFIVNQIYSKVNKLWPLTNNTYKFKKSF
jgi:hypothetical protein